MDFKRCAYSSCGKRLHIRNNERADNFKARITCDKTCASLYGAEKGKRTRAATIPTEIAQASVNGLKHLEPDHNPDMCHSIPASRVRICIDVHKTEAEVDRMWEYNKMFGKGY